MRPFGDLTASPLSPTSVRARRRRPPSTTAAHAGEIPTRRTDDPTRRRMLLVLIEVTTNVREGLLPWFGMVAALPKLLHGSATASNIARKCR
jgi:hypothetical protein